MDTAPGLRITTWNGHQWHTVSLECWIHPETARASGCVMSIMNDVLSRNPFAYEPWREKRSFAAMFDILEADIVVMQETKIQRKDLRDEMVLVPGWDVFFSLPKHKKGYSGVAVYTRNAVCAPIRAEEGITGILTSPNSTTSFRDLPDDQQIGGYPSASQLSEYPVDSAMLDSEGRCVILEFPAFVLIGVYNPANRNETRDEFRLGFLSALDARIRNLVAVGKRVFLTGDLNIIREEIDTANAEEQLRKQGITLEQYISTPARRIFNQLLVGGKVFGGRDEGRENPVLWDICRSFHPDRRGMFTCWEQKTNARPGNFGSRIDYVLCSEDWKDWFCASDIQEGLMGSDHCPVYATMKWKVEINGAEVCVRDMMSDGMFEGGVRQREWSSKDLLPLSARLIPEFDRRRNIRDMFTKMPSLPSGESSTGRTTDGFGLREVEKNDTPSSENVTSMQAAASNPLDALSASPSSSSVSSKSNPINPPSKRPVEQTLSPTHRSKKRSKPVATPKSTPTSAKGQPPKGQSSLMGFFKPKVSSVAQSESTANQPAISLDTQKDPTGLAERIVSSNSIPRPVSRTDGYVEAENMTDIQSTESIGSDKPLNIEDGTLVDPILAKEGWSKLLGKRIPPRCEHNEACVSYLTKKTGINCGRSFYMCPRPLGPSGQKEKNSEWRCGTFVWSSDWTGGGGGS
ncbi:hypothetical protein B7494_g6086 [Chlorociboria aeruginascens]|nr:hypothetical protein B7494_g6086 [Chlorociboria aeruginascens]